MGSGEAMVRGGICELYAALFTLCSSLLLGVLWVR